MLTRQQRNGYHAAMRIAIDARLPYYVQGGIASYVRALMTRLPLQDSANDYLMLHARRPALLPVAPSARSMRCWTPAHHRLERLALAVELWPHRPHLLHSPDFICPLAAGWRSVITIHDLTFLIYPQFLTADSRRYYNHQISAMRARIASRCGPIFGASQMIVRSTKSMMPPCLATRLAAWARNWIAMFWP